MYTGKIEGVPVTGLIDIGSDITIVHGDIPHWPGLEANQRIRGHVNMGYPKYDQKFINLDRISFGKNSFCTTVYISS